MSSGSFCTGARWMVRVAMLSSKRKIGNAKICEDSKISDLEIQSFISNTTVLSSDDFPR